MIKICSKVNHDYLVFFKTQPRLALVFGQNIHIYNSETGDLIKIIFHHKSSIKLLHEDGNNMIALDKKGVLSVWNSENLSLVSQNQFPREVAKACITSNSESIYYLNTKESGIFRVPLLSNTANWIYSEEIIQQAASKAFKIMLTPNNRFLVNYGEHEIFIYDTESQSLINKLKHMTNITALDIHPQNESIIVGDKNGRIYFYYGVFIPHNKIVSSSMHWHSHSVKALCISYDGTQLLSGGEEGVVVFWHLNANKKTFCPRLGSAITSLKIDPTRKVFAALLHSNVLKVIKMNNFEELNRIGSLTNPQDFSNNREFLQDVWTRGVKVQPRTNNLSVQGAPGQIQLFDVWNFQRVKDIQIVERNFVSRVDEDYPTPVLVSHYDFSNDGKYLATIEQRYSNNDNFFFCNLKFWSEDGLNNYNINTLVEHPHGLKRVKDLLFIELADKSAIFATVGEDNTIKLWGKRERKETTATATSTAQKRFIWGPIGEITYKKLNVDTIKFCEELGSDNKDVLIFNAENNLVIWDIKSYKPIFTLNIGGGENKIQDVEICNDRVIISTKEGLWILDANLWKVTHQIPLLNIQKMLYNKSNNFLYILARQANKSIIFLLDAETYAVLKVVILKDKVFSLLLLKSNDQNQTKAILLCEDMSFYVFDEDIQENIIDSFSRNRATNDEKRLVLNDASLEERRNINDNLIARDKDVLNVNMFNFFSWKTHLLPPISAMYKPLVERFLTKVGEVEVQQEQPASGAQGSMNEEIIETEKQEADGSVDNLQDFIKKFTGSVEKLYVTK